MKRVTIIVAVATIGALLSGHFSPLQAQAPQSPLTEQEIKELKEAVEVHEGYLGRLYDLLNDLQYTADESSNANRRSAINSIHELMAQVILQMEDEVGKNRRIQQHGNVQNYDESRDKGAGMTMPGSRKEFQQNFDTGGSTPGKYWIYRLAQMQSVYRVCSTAREPAISKHQNGLPFFMDKSEEFARLMERNVSDVYGILPDTAEPERPSKDKYQARKSKYE
jgi:hypothetical protein